MKEPEHIEVSQHDASEDEMDMSVDNTDDVSGLRECDAVDNVTIECTRPAVSSVTLYTIPYV